MKRLCLPVLLLFAATAFPKSAAALKIGDPAPPLNIGTWVKGDPVDVIKGKGKNIYVVEFWATWCPPCVQSIPHLTQLQKQYKDKNVHFVSITDEPKDVVKRFVKKMGAKMEYVVACDKQQLTHAAYMTASGQMGIPTAFLIDRKGRVAWIGSPFGVEGVLAEVVAGTYDIKQAIADEDFFRKHHLQLMLAMQSADWESCLRIAQMVADPNSPMSRMMRSHVLHAVAWSMLTDERSDKKYFQEALFLAKSAYDACGCEEPSIIDTYARALFDNGKLQEAVQYQRQAVNFAPNGMMKAELQESLKRYEDANTGR